MQAVFSLIENIPLIHQIHPSENSVKEGWIDIVLKYISEKRGQKNLENLTVPLSEIKLETFTEYPTYTYIVTDDKNIDIYVHQLIDRVEKGWIWNGTSKTVESKKIGYFQILPVLDDKNMIDSELIVEKIKNTPDEPSGLSNIQQNYQDDLIKNLIHQIVDEIQETKSTLEKEIEEVKNLPDLLESEPMDLCESQDNIYDSYLCDDNLSIDFSGLPCLLDYSEDSNKSSIYEYTKRNMYNYKNIFLPDLDNIKLPEKENKKVDATEETFDKKEDPTKEQYPENQTLECEDKQESEPIQMEDIIPRYQSSQRGLRAIRRNMGRLGLGLPPRNSMHVTKLRKYRPIW